MLSCLSPLPVSGFWSREPSGALGSAGLRQERRTGVCGPPLSGRISQPQGHILGGFFASAAVFSVTRECGGRGGGGAGGPGVLARPCAGGDAVLASRVAVVLAPDPASEP